MNLLDRDASAMPRRIARGHPLLFRVFRYGTGRPAASRENT
jgi:hypothetical protein